MALFLHRIWDITFQNLLQPWNLGKRSLKVIKCGIIQQLAYDFLLASDNNSCL